MGQSDRRPGQDISLPFAFETLDEKKDVSTIYSNHLRLDLNIMHKLRIPGLWHVPRKREIYALLTRLRRAFDGPGSLSMTMSIRSRTQPLYGSWACN